MLICLIMLPPAVADETENSQRGKSQIKDPLIQGLRGPFTQLLRGPGTDGALRLHTDSTGRQQNEQDYKKHPSVPHHNYLLALKVTI
jgi:hypothetical protein